jgi:ABC-type transport system involved in cytochrome c biogenesis permease component
MTFLPIVERELRTAARQRVTHRMRLMAAGLALLIWFLLAIAGGNLTPAQRAGAIFSTISILSLGFAMLAGVFLTADCLSEERREGTLGLLFLTDLKGHDVVLGKLASTSLHAIYGLLAVGPMLAVPLLMGGVTPGEFGRTALVLLATLFLSLSAGMFVSAISYDSRAAFLRTLGIMLLVSGLLPVLWWGGWIFWRQAGFNFLLWPSPGYGLRCAGDGFYSTRGGPGEFWLSLFVIGGLGMIFLVVASALLPRVWQQARDETGGAQPAWKPAPKRSSVSLAGLEYRPFYWLAIRDPRVGRWAFWTIGPAFVIWFAFFAGGWRPRNPGAGFSIVILLSFALHVLFKCMVATEATRRLSEDRQSGALELLLVTPLPPADILRGQRQALALLFRWPKWILVLMNLLLLWQIFWPDASRWAGPDRSIFAIIIASGIVFLFTDCQVIGPVAIWSALTTRRHTRAILKTVRKVLLPSWLAILALWFMGISTGSISSATVETFFVAWVIFGLGVDVVLWAQARSRLGANFRELAAGSQTLVAAEAPILPR